MRKNWGLILMFPLATESCQLKHSSHVCETVSKCSPFKSHSIIRGKKAICKMIGCMYRNYKIPINSVHRRWLVEYMLIDYWFWLGWWFFYLYALGVPRHPNFSKCILIQFSQMPKRAFPFNSIKIQITFVGTIKAFSPLPSPCQAHVRMLMAVPLTQVGICIHQ